MSYRGDIRLSKTIDMKFPTRQASGAPTTLAGSPVISAYPDNSTTQITAGITLTVDFDGVTGANNVRVVATGANGYVTATNYDLMITTGTVNSVSVVGEIIGAFSIENRSALMPTVADRTADVAVTGEIGLDFNNVLSSSLITLHSLTITGALTHTGHVLYSDGVEIAAPSTANRPGLSVTGVGTGAGAYFQGGASAGGYGIRMIGIGDTGLIIQTNGTNKPAVDIAGSGAAAGVRIFSGAGATGNALELISQATNGSALSLTSTGTGAGLLTDKISVTGTATIAGAFTANNAANDIAGVALSAAQVTSLVAAVMAYVIETGVSLSQAVQAILSVASSTSDGFPGAGVKHFKNPAGTKNRVTITTDADGNRTSAPTYDFT